MRPALKAGLLPVWRDRETVQIGIDPRRAVILTGLGAAVAVLGLLDGSRERDQVIAAAQACGIPAAVTDRVLTLLAAGGVLDDVPATGPGGRDSRAGRDRPDQPGPRGLRAERAGAALARGHSDAGAAVLARRAAARVRIYGPGRVATALAGILADSGIGAVTVCATVRPPRPRSPRPDPGAGARLPLPDLAVLVGYQDPGLGAWLGRAGVTHLAVAAQEAIGVVGPLVRPGQTACLRCLDLTRAGLDSAWPLILAQLAGRAAEPAACDATLAATVAAQASAQVLAVIDRDPRSPAAENGTLELVQPSWRWRRRTWPAHPGCDCGAAATSGGGER